MQICFFDLKKDGRMDQENNKSSIGTIEKSDNFLAKNDLKHANNSDNFLKLIAEIIVEIIIKETSDEYSMVRKDKG
jgi:hypothetical protein